MNRRPQLPGPIESQDKASFTPFSPASVGTLGLWYDWSLKTLTDQSGSGRNGTGGGTGTRAWSVTNGLTSYVLAHQSYITFTSISVRTVIRCFQSLCSDWFWMLSDSGNYQWHSTSLYLLSSANAHTYAKNGTWRLNGTSVNPLTTDITAMGIDYGKPIIVSCVTTGGLSQNRIGFDRTYTAVPFILCEDLIWTDALTSDQVRKVEHYLANKWSVEGFNFAT